MYTDEQKHAALVDLFKSRKRVQFEFEAKAAWVLLGTIQLALRHPSFTGPHAKAMMEIADSLGRYLAGDDPVLQDLVRDGWSDEDQRRSGC